MATRSIDSTTASVVSGRTGVDSAKSGRAGKIGKSANTPSIGGGDNLAKSSDVNLSPRAKEMALERKKAMDIAKGTPDIREDRVQELKKQIQEGSYKADSGRIADGMLREASRDYLANNDE